ncbi:MAG TPA: NHL repeat-containing protein, partial [Terracidiphilus sp.]|nr:NHL repeat-containing protein [Terracidiphilus sp.]
MATTSFTAMRRLAGIAFLLMLTSVCLTKAAAGQSAPQVTASAVAGLPHPSGWGAIEQTAIDSFGDWFVVDYANGAVYEFPVGGGPAIVISGNDGLSGNYQNPGIAIDPGNNIYMEANWNNCIVMFPWDAANKAWTGLTEPDPRGPAVTVSGVVLGPPFPEMSPTNPSTTLCTNSGSNDWPTMFAQYNVTDTTGLGGWFQPWGIAIGNNNNLIMGTNSGNAGTAIQSLTVTGAWSNPKAATWNWIPATGLTQRPSSIAQDPEGNVYFVEDYTQTTYLPGVYEIPATATSGQYKTVTADKVTTNADCPVYGNGPTDPPTGSSCLTRVDPNLPAVVGVITDPAGNLYISDSQVGIVMVPNPSGTPDPTSAVVVAPVPAQGEVAFDWARSAMYVPTKQAQTNGLADVARVGFGSGEFGASTVGTKVTTGPNVVFEFNGSVVPANYTIVEDGVQTPDFAITGGTCTTGTTSQAGQSCLENVSFTPHSVGSVTAKLLMLDAKSNILASMLLHGTGVGANIQATPSLQSTIGGSLNTPSQVAVDAVGNVFIADAGLGQVVEYAAGAGASSAPVSIGTNLSAPTGVAVDGAGDVFIADSGNVYEVPFGANGLNSAGQITLVAGLGMSGLQLAADGSGNLYVADPSNHRVVKVSDIGAATITNLGENSTFLTNGFTSPSAVAVDANNNLYVIDGSNLFEVAGGIGTPTTLLNDLSSATGLAVDPSGAVYISAAGGTVRIPLVSGALSQTNQTPIATATNPTSVTLDRWGNIYV